MEFHQSEIALAAEKGAVNVHAQRVHELIDNRASYPYLFRNYLGIGLAFASAMRPLGGTSNMQAGLQEEICLQ